MPIYAFRCEQCGHDFDRLQKLADPDPENCPSCGAAAVKRAVTAPAFRLAGSGWYETDFKKGGDRKRNLADGGDGAARSGEGAAKGSEGASTDAAKPAPAASAKPAEPAAAPKTTGA